MSDSSNSQAIDLGDPDRISSVNLDSLSEDQILSIPRTEKHLSHLRVRELRTIARDECGPGTWIAHASKDQLIEGTLLGHEPPSVQPDDKGESPPDVESDSSSRPERSTLSEARAEPVAQSLIDLITKIAKKVVRSEIQRHRSDEATPKSPREEITEILEEEAEKSEEAAERINDELEPNGKDD